MEIIDLTQTIINDMQVYPGDNPPRLSQSHTIEGNSYTNHKLTFGMHAGTHIDGPWHMVDPKRFISEMPLECFVGKACIIDIQNVRIFSDTQLVKEKSKDCSIILFHTGFGKFFGSDKSLSGYPIIDNNVAQLIADLKIKLIGIDSFSPDITPYPVHKTLLQSGVLIAENLTNLHLLLNKGKFEVIALPLKIEADSAPARIIAIIK